MEKYRKSNQYYIDEYDRMTIGHLKEVEQLIHEAEKQFNIDVNNPHSDKTNTDLIKYQIQYLDAGVHFARNKEVTIRAKIESDERKDHLLQSNPIPTNVRCSTCHEIMEFKLHDFVEKSEGLIFFFSCVNGHIPMKAVYPNGREYFMFSHSCTYCGGQLITEKRKTNNQLIITDTCEQCGKTEVLEFDRSPKKILPINNKDRKKYCTDFINRNDLYEDLKLLTDNLSDLSNRQEDKNRYNYDQVEQLNISQMEQVLSEQIKKSEFIKVRFDKPKSNRFLIVEFSAQDPTDREGTKSIKILKKTIETTLFTTNWRLMSPGISYKLGFLNGKLKGYSLEEDIIKIAKEIAEKKSK